MKDYKLESESPWGVVAGVLAQTALLGLYFVALSPVWVPVAIYNTIKKSFEPKPVYRGTVRPLRSRDQ